MLDRLKKLPIDERIQIVEELWDSIADDQETLGGTEEQRIVIDRRLDAYKLLSSEGRIAYDIVSDIRKRL